MSHAYTTTNTRKRKSKLTSAKYNQYCADWLQHKKDCKRLGMKPKTMDEYILYRQGKYKPELKGVVKDPMAATTLRREAPKYQSGAGIGVSFGRKENTYTGTLIKGIATMHKSNAVPIISQEQAHEVARMRRG
jgi:hypothetical protein